MKRILTIIFGLITILTIFLVKSVFAQTEEPSWSEPVNLSRSGSATTPHILVDVYDRIHVIWQDDFNGTVYTLGSEGSWSNPQPTDFPFSDHLNSVKLFSDSTGFIHGVWLNKDQTLNYSRVPAQYFPIQANWSPPQIMAFSVLDFDMDVTPAGELLLAFGQASTSDSSAGIYTRSKPSGGDVWTPAQSVYTSPYLRGLSEEQFNITVSSNGNKSYLAWDEQPQELIWLSTSDTLGASWATPSVIDRRQPDDGSSSGPKKPLLLTETNGEVLTWQAGHTGVDCAQYFSQTQDGGQTWSEPDYLPDPFNQFCPGSIEPISLPDGSQWLAVKTTDGYYFLAWDSTSETGSWSSPRLQPALSGFTNPQTFRPVSLSCQNSTATKEQLMVVGCEEPTNGDIWLLTRPHGDVQGWFPTPTPPPVWSEPIIVTENPSAITSPAVTSDDQNRLHTLWTVKGDNSLYYALFDGAVWSSPQSILFSPGNQPQNLSVLLHSGMLMVAWDDLSTGMIYTSQVSINEALDSNAWSAPAPITTADLAGNQPQLAQEADGLVYLAFVVSLNEGRGIYLVHSLETVTVNQEPAWTEPIQVFDAIAAGWDSLNSPRLSVGSDNRVHLLWSQASLPPNPEILGLFASSSLEPLPNESRSIINWSDPEEIVQGPVNFSQILTVQNGAIHRAWQQISAGQPILLHQFLQDGGKNWSIPERVAGLENSRGPATMTNDAAGGLNMVQLEPEAMPQGRLLHWRWEGDEWKAQDEQTVTGLSNETEIIAASLSTGDLAVLFTGKQPVEVSQPGSESNFTSSEIYSLSFMSRSLGVESMTYIPSPTEVSPVNETATDQLPNSTQPIENPPPTQTFSKEAPGRMGFLLRKSITTIVVGAVPAIFFLGLVLIFLVRKITDKG